LHLVKEANSNTGVNFNGKRVANLVADIDTTSRYKIEEYKIE